jgi:predicted nucleic acid-binding protein
VSGTLTAELRARRRGILYADTSALLKLAVHENESEAFAREVVRWRWLATSRVTNVELPRALARARVERPDALRACRRRSPASAST